MKRVGKAAWMSAGSVFVLGVAMACSSESDSGDDGGGTTGGTSASGGIGNGSGGADPGGAPGSGGVGPGGAPNGCNEPEKGPWGDELGADTLGGKYAGYFPLGAALSDAHLNDATASEIAETHFNHFTAENVMKPEVLQPTEGSFNWTQADKLANFARARGQKITFHTIVWHRQTPSWFFADLGGAPGSAEAIETLKNRLRLHIEAVVDRYADVVSNWDVVNEAVETSDYRTNSPWYEQFGGPEYIYWAFHYTREALEAKEPCSSAGKLYYNDFNLNQKIERVLAMAEWLETEHGLRIDGIGDQAHYRIDWPGVAADLRPTYQAIVDAGYKLKISELDVTVYNDYPPPEYSFVAAPEVPYDSALGAQLASRYADLFGLFREFSEHITSVTLWGINDDASWLNNEPVEGRANYPLLWDGSYQPKAAFDAVLDFED